VARVGVFTGNPFSCNADVRPTSFSADSVMEELTKKLAKRNLEREKVSAPSNEQLLRFIIPSITLIIIIFCG
jgi:hypothetical protein